jgi:hypothetical protein
VSVDNKRLVVSDCCESNVYFVPPSMGDTGFHFCANCSRECKTKLLEVNTHKETQKDVSKPINKDNG